MLLYSVWIKKAVAVPIDFMSSEEDVAFILNDCKPEAIFYTNTTKDVCEKATAQLNGEIQKINLDEIKFEQIEGSYFIP